MLNFLFHWILVPTIVSTSDWIFFSVQCNWKPRVPSKFAQSSYCTNLPSRRTIELSKIRSGSYVVFDLIEIERVCRRRLLRKSIQKSKVKAKNWKKIPVNLASLSRSNGASSISKEKCGSNMYPAFLMTSSPALFGLEGQTKALDFSASRHGAVSSTRQP